MSAIPRIPPETREDAYVLFLARVEQSQIAQMLEINFNTLRQWIMKGKWTERRTKHEEMMAQMRPPEKRPIVQAIGKSRDEAKKIYEQKMTQAAAADAEHIADKMIPEERLAAAPNIKALAETHRKTLGFDEEKEHDTRHISLSFLTDPKVKIIDAVEIKQIEDHAPQTE
jgi:hypothetical protein